MFVAHLPVGYLLSRTFKSREPAVERWKAPVLLLGSVFPDLDLFYFYLIDDRQHVHHSYWTHKPLYWLAVGTVAFVASSRMPRARGLSLCFLLGICAHLVLDTWVGGIRWFSPFSEIELSLFEVAPAGYGWWVWNFLLHWTFGLEIVLCLVALAIAGSKPKREGLDVIGRPENPLR